MQKPHILRSPFTQCSFSDCDRLMTDVKRLGLTKKAKEVASCGVHEFGAIDVQDFRLNLLKWYDKNKRILPWRLKLSDPDPNMRGYSTWVSEIMLQQTQVATVIDYYNKWMKKWPTVIDLAKASIEEVNEVWSGLGYYSRASRLHQGAQKVVSDLKSEFPRESKDLRSLIPGVGDYTASAIASIAFGEVTGLVDGNVIRVLSRLRTIGADSDSTTARQTFWRLANVLVDPQRPGDFNQALMELGATICQPRNPSCDRCPVRDQCMARQQVCGEIAKKKASFCGDTDIKTEKENETEDIENCHLCLSKKDYNVELGVTNYPNKKQKKAPREDVEEVLIIYRQDSCLNTTVYMIPGNVKGLLAGLWRFPGIEESSKSLSMRSTSCGEIVHVFSHIRRSYVIRKVKVDCEISDELPGDGKWLEADEFEAAAVSRAMRKVYSKFIESFESKTKTKNPSGCKNRKRTSDVNLSSTDTKRQSTLTNFLK